MVLKIFKFENPPKWPIPTSLRPGLAHLRKMGCQIEEMYEAISQPMVLFGHFHLNDIGKIGLGPISQIFWKISWFLDCHRPMHCVGLIQAGLSEISSIFYFWEILFWSFFFHFRWLDWSRVKMKKNFGVGGVKGLAARGRTKFHFLYDVK